MISAQGSDSYERWRAVPSERITPPLPNRGGDPATKLVRGSVANQLLERNAPLAGSAMGTLEERTIRLKHHSFRWSDGRINRGSWSLSDCPGVLWPRGNSGRFRGSDPNRGTSRTLYSQLCTSRKATVADQLPAGDPLDELHRLVDRRQSTDRVGDANSLPSIGGVLEDRGDSSGELTGRRGSR
jgi:hypothetical protein